MLQDKIKITYLKYTIILIILLISSYIYGCTGGGSDGATIATREPGDIYLPPISTPAYQQYELGQEAFNLGNYLNAQTNFQKAYELSKTTREKNLALTGLGWAMLKNGSEAGSSDTNSVIFTLEKISQVDLYNYANQEINDARVALALAYLSRSNSTQDYINAISLLERIDPIKNGITYLPNKFFTYTPKLNHGVNNGQVHAILAYLYFLQGNNQLAIDHINYAQQIAPSDEKVLQIKANLTVLGLFR